MEHQFDLFASPPAPHPKANPPLRAYAAYVAAVLLALAFLFAGCSKKWGAIGYHSRSDPDVSSIRLGTFPSEEKAREAGQHFIKANPQGDYIIGPLTSDGGFASKHR